MADLDPRLIEAWSLAALVLGLKMIGVAQIIGATRLLQGSFAAVEGDSACCVTCRCRRPDHDGSALVS